MVVRNINRELDEPILIFKTQIEESVGREVTYKLASKLYVDIIKENIYINNMEKQTARRKKDRKVIFSIEMKDE